MSGVYFFNSIHTYSLLIKRRTQEWRTQPMWAYEVLIAFVKANSRKVFEKKFKIKNIFKLKFPSI